MRLDEFVEGFERDEAAERRRLAREKSYAITDHLETVERRLERHLDGDTLVGESAPEIFVGRSGYPSVSAGLLSPVGAERDPTAFATSGRWYEEGLAIDDVLRRRTGLLNARRPTNVHAAGRPVADTWEGFLGVQREVAIADRPVDVEVGLDGRPDIDLGTDSVRTPTGPTARAERADLTGNPHVPRAVEKTLEDDDWHAEGAIAYLYRRGFDVYDINTILSAGALGRADRRRLVPTRWSITAVDDTVGQFLRGGLRNESTVGRTEVWTNEYVGNRYWVVLAPGQWEFEFVELKAPDSVWNPRPGAGYYLSAAREGYEGRTGYVEETTGAYYAARLAVLEHLRERDRQAKCLVLREITDDYWAPVGVWQVREGIRHAFEGEPGVAGSLADALDGLAPVVPVSPARLRRKSAMAAGVQASLADF